MIPCYTIPMPHFFISPGQIEDDIITVTGGDVHHIKDVLRLRVGDDLTFGDGVTALCHHARVRVIAADAIHCELIYSQPHDHELAAKVHLFQSLPKGDKMEHIIQKTVELGVHEIIPIITERTVIRLDAKRAAAKKERWQAVSNAAAKQSLRLYTPPVRDVTAFSEAVRIAATMDVRIIPYEKAAAITDTRNIIAAIRPGQAVAIFIGPEGGFSPREIELAGSAAIRPITLGRRILRTETAGPLLMGWIMLETEGG